MTNFEEEKRYLDYTLDCINDEISSAKKRIEALRKEGISLTFEDTKRGEHLNVSSLITFNEDKIRRLNNMIPTPYFGRFDFTAEKDGLSSKVYIGKSGMSRDGGIIITDWRAPICSLYYDSEVGPTEYLSNDGINKGELSLKRQITIKDSELVDVVDTSLVSNDELLRPYLSINADNKMKTIIASIQKEQNQIIRKPLTKNIIVQGVAGSGKTSVALHRIAYLIYNVGDRIRNSNFLILGPNNYFLNYISSILPELETEPVEQMTFHNLANEYLGEKLGLEKDDLSLSGNEKIMSENIQKYKTSLEFKSNLDQFIKNYISSNLVTEGFKINGEEVYSPEDIYQFLFYNNKDFPDYDSAYKYAVYNFKNEMDSIYSTLNKKYREIYTSLPKGDPQREEAVRKSIELQDEIKKNGLSLLKKYFKNIRKSPIDLYKLFIGMLDQMDTPLSSEEIKYLQKRTLLTLKKKKACFEDLPAIMYIKYLLNGKQINYKHIVIDEAQDYGPFHYNVMKAISKDSNFSIYGDLAQAIYPARSIDNWEIVKDIIGGNSEILNLSKSYRTTIEITENANKVLNRLNLSSANPVIRHGADVSFMECANDNEFKVNKIKEWIEKGYKTIAVICKTDKEVSVVEKLLAQEGLDVKTLSLEDNKYEGGLFVLTSISAKGLEFDAVMINDASEKVYSSDSDLDMHLLYVASTRALHEQVILYNKTLTGPYNDKTLDQDVMSKKLVKN